MTYTKEPITIAPNANNEPINCLVVEDISFTFVCVNDSLQYKLAAVAVKLSDKILVQVVLVRTLFVVGNSSIFEANAMPTVERQSANT